MILTVLIITAVIAFIVDYSGIIDSLKKFINVILYKGKADPANINIKPFSCSLCMSFWTVLIYAICMSLGWIECLALASLAGFSASFLAQSYFTIRHVWQQFLAWIVKSTS